MKKQIDISKDFWKEFESRGFSMEKESGGTFLDKYSQSNVEKLGHNIYKLTKDGVPTEITVIDPKLFFKTVKKIENIVKYKLFY